MNVSDFLPRTWVFVDVDGGLASLAALAEVARIAPGLQAQLREDLAPEWGVGVDDTVSPGPMTSDAALAAKHCQIQWHAKAPTDAGDAIAIHGVDANGNPIAHFYADIAQRCNVSPSSCISHEMLEASADPECDRVATLPDGRVVAVEICDAVEAFTYQKLGVEVSAFSLPSNFGIGGNAAPYDSLGKATTQFEVLLGGYAQVRTADGWQQLSPGRRCAIGDCCAPAERRTNVCADHRRLGTGHGSYRAALDRLGLGRGARRRAR